MQPLKKTYRHGDTIKIRRFSQMPRQNGRIVTLFIPDGDLGGVPPMWSDRHQLWLVRARRPSSKATTRSRCTYYWFTEDVL